MGFVLASIIEEKRASKVLYSGMFIVILGRVIIGGQVTLKVPYGTRADNISLSINISNSIKTNTY